MTYQFCKWMVEISRLMDFNHCTKTTQHTLVNHCWIHYSLHMILLVTMPCVKSWQDSPAMQTDSYTSLECQPAAGVSLSQWIITSNGLKKYSKADKTTHLKAVFSISWEIKIYMYRGFSAHVLRPFQDYKKRERERRIFLQAQGLQ